ncbi:hypothetical protein CFAM422_008792 [Trichoderma lentiforme]|uniref:Uncharacterized protein n=1 Tax=Trichoderma lentiforme TaxID=1567552 RepID=A0A9P5CAX2_9HYPO|nr:hypothetical protein CFAM422_008792 [Trichoderma lentiforme]
MSATPSVQVRVCEAAADPCRAESNAHATQPQCSFFPHHESINRRQLLEFPFFTFSRHGSLSFFTQSVGTRTGAAPPKCGYQEKESVFQVFSRNGPQTGRKSRQSRIRD